MCSSTTGSKGFGPLPPAARFRGSQDLRDSRRRGPVTLPEDLSGEAAESLPRKGRHTNEYGQDREASLAGLRPTRSGSQDRGDEPADGHFVQDHRTPYQRASRDSGDQAGTVDRLMAREKKRGRTRRGKRGSTPRRATDHLRMIERVRSVTGPGHGTRKIDSLPTDSLPAGHPPRRTSKITQRSRLHRGGRDAGPVPRERPPDVIDSFHGRGSLHRAGRGHRRG